MMLVLGILGSPRQGGNTEILLDEALGGAGRAGAAVEKLRLSDLDMSGCIECEECYATGRCSIEDGMAKVYDALERADRILLASPIFFMGLPSQAKAMIDRTQCYWSLKYLLKEGFPARCHETRYGSFIGVGATRGERLFDGSILTLKYFFDAIDVKPLRDSYLLVRGVDEKGEVREKGDVLERAAALGKLLATEG
jgi:multimeric flavodoxin WrbA